MKCLIIIPSTGFDPGQVSVIWEILKSGREVFFGTLDGSPGAADEIMLESEKMGVISRLFAPNKRAKKTYSLLIQDENFKEPLKLTDGMAKNFEGLVVPGGYGPGMKKLVESEAALNVLKEFVRLDKPIAVLGSGAYLLARLNEEAEAYYLNNKDISIQPEIFETFIWEVTRDKCGDHFKLYPDKTVESEMRKSLKQARVHVGPPMIIKDSLRRLWAGHISISEKLVSGRWVGDVHKLAYKFKELTA